MNALNAALNHVNGNGIRNESGNRNATENRNGDSDNAKASTTAAAVTRGRGHPQQVDMTARGEQG
ncbi:hypothetical protein SAMN05428954_0693 [Streptomyces sp. 2112.3]|nr:MULTISPECIES: hypothetical protein [unclassified Streptomyces]PBC86443.1 hypothetical protein BX261_6530 [Streptomyces sp. 2321.6]SED65203.1 hypothetical protein SAMN05428954_0693 [Streptomyces sp. 2112.3]SED98696.1 hypothetical protein SAMN05428940_6558 [Streptomyces sp. 2133.1]SNC73377.1 hypothetical protein SAMN06272741_6460 [Streptomyces sp. 2114.4]